MQVSLRNFNLTQSTHEHDKDLGGWEQELTGMQVNRGGCSFDPFIETVGPGRVCLESTGTLWNSHISYKLNQRSEIC